jgi:hypothetical protein
MSHPVFTSHSADFSGRCCISGCRGESEIVVTVESTLPHALGHNQLGNVGQVLTICAGCIDSAVYMIDGHKKAQRDRASREQVVANRISKSLKPCKRCNVPSKRNRQGLCRRCAICVKADKPRRAAAARAVKWPESE